MFGAIDDLSYSQNLTDNAKTTLPEIIECNIYKNKQSGLLVRSGAEPTISACHIHQNGDFGVLLQVGVAERGSVPKFARLRIRF
jgi:hypothetical protein